jgi:hypothetical protein
VSAADQGAVVLRPRSILEMLDTAFALLRRDYVTLLTVMAIVSLPQTLVTVLWTSEILAASLNADEVGASMSMGGTIFPFLAWLVWSPFVDAALIAAASESYMGRQPTVPGALKSMTGKFGVILGVMLLRALALIGGLALLIVGSVYFYLRFYCAVGVAMIEDRRAGESFSRSTVLTQNALGRVLGTLMLVYLIYTCLSVLPAVPALFMQNATLLSVLSALATIVLYPMWPVVATVLYYDLRVRKEGLDIEMLAGELGPASAVEPARQFSG